MLTLLSLDSDTRRWMLEELARDLAAGTLYISPRLSPEGRKDYPQLLEEAIRLYNEAWLAAQLRSSGRLNDVEVYTRSEQTYHRRVPVNAAEMLAEGEFNRFYMRGLSQRAIAEKLGPLVVYRAKSVSQPRRESEQKIGSEVDPEKLLADLRVYIGVDTALGLPAGPNSGLSAMLRRPVAVTADG